MSAAPEVYDAAQECVHCGERIVFDEWGWVHGQTSLANCTVPRRDGRRHTDGSVVALLLTVGLPMLNTHAWPKEADDV